MAFSNDTYATVWEVTAVKDTITKCKISTRTKNKTTGEYETDFSGYVNFVGTVNAKHATKLQERDRIKLGKVAVRNHYDKEKKSMFWDCVVFYFEDAEGSSGSSSAAPVPDNTCPQPAVGDGEIDDSRLPF